MDPAGVPNGHGHLVLGGGGLTADPDIDLLNEAWWLHSVFSCPLHAEASVTPLQYAGMTSLVEDQIRIPGNHTGATTSRARTNLLLLLRHWYEPLWRLHRAGFTLRGQFTAVNFLVYLATLDLRMIGKLHLSRYTPEGGDQDHLSFARSVRQVLTLHETIPPHIAQWLELVEEGGVGREYLIRYNIALMEPRQVLATLMSLRTRLEELLGTDPAVYRQIMRRLAPYDNWQFLTSRNALMHATRRYTERRLRRRGQRGPAFHPTARGLLTVIRNCSQHAGRRHEHLMHLIIEEDFQRFAALFQRVMYDMSQIQFLNLEVSMA